MKQEMLEIKPKQSEFSFDNLRKKVIANVQAPVKTVEDLERFLASWWCRRYNKPYRCIEVMAYTTEELIMEYLDVLYREHPEKMEVSEDDSKAKEQDAEQDEDWLQKQMGSKYISKEKQDADLKPLEADIAEAVKNADVERHVRF